MINLPNFSSRNRSTYPGVFTPNPFISEALDEKSSFNVRSEIFSNIHISEDEEYFLIEIDTPGLRREDFLIRINERGNLLVSGIHKENIGFPIEEFDQPSNSYSGFSREILLPENVDTDFVRAQCRSGVLSICFLLTSRPYPKRPSIVVVY